MELGSTGALLKYVASGIEVIAFGEVDRSVIVVEAEYHGNF